jgi:hypothetical protein
MFATCIFARERLICMSAMASGLPMHCLPGCRRTVRPKPTPEQTCASKPPMTSCHGRACRASPRLHQRGIPPIRALINHIDCGATDGLIERSRNRSCEMAVDGFSYRKTHRTLSAVRILPDKIEAALGTKELTCSNDHESIGVIIFCCPGGDDHAIAGAAIVLAQPFSSTQPFFCQAGLG